MNTSTLKSTDIEPTGPRPDYFPGGIGDDQGWRTLMGGVCLLAALALAVVVVGLVHLSQGTSGLGAGDLIRALLGARTNRQDVSAADIVIGSRLPRLLAGIVVGLALGIAGCLLQSVSRNPLASPDTLAVTAGAYFALSAVAAFGLAVPLWASSAAAFTGGVLAAGLVLSLTGLSSGTATTRLILAGSAVAMALDAGTAMLLILFQENTTGLFAWGSGSLAQLSIEASTRAGPLIAAIAAVSILIARRLDVLNLGDDAASSLGVPVRTTRTVAIVGAVLLTSVSVTVAGPIGFVGLGAPVLTRLLTPIVPSLRRHVIFIPASGLVGAGVILLADVTLRTVLGAEGASAIPTGIPTAMLGGIIIILLARRVRDARSVRTPAAARSPLRTRARFIAVSVVVIMMLLTAVVIALTAGSLWLRLGDLLLWFQGGAPELITRALDERAARIAAAVLAGAALALAGVGVQGVVRNPLAEPGLLGISTGAGLGAVLVVTTGLGEGGRTVLVAFAVTFGLLTFGLITALAWGDGLLPDRFVLTGIGCGYALGAISTYLLLRSDPWETPRILTWLSGTTYGRSLPDVVPVALVLVVAVPVLLTAQRKLDLLAIDEDTPRILGVSTGFARLGILALSSVLAAVAVVAVGTIGFVGLVAPHLARNLVGARHARVIPVALGLGGLLVLVADTVGRTAIAPAQLPAGLVVALIGAPYFIWLMRRTRF